MDMNLVNTKQEIAKVYKKAIDAVNAKASVVFDPKKEAKSKKNAEVVEKANTVKAEQTAEAIVKLQGKMDASFTELITILSTKIDECNTIDETIAIKKEALKNMYDIEVTAETLAGLINAQSEAKAIFEAEIADLKAAAEKEVADLVDLLQAEREKHNTTIREVDAETADRRAKAAAEWEYNFERKKKVENDSWEDTKKARERELAEKEEENKTFEVDLLKREKNVSDLETKVAEIPTLVANAKEEGLKDGKAKAAQEYVFEKRALEADYKAQKAVADNTISMLNSTIDRQNTEIADLKAKLDAAYAEIKDVAAKTVEASANSRTIAALEKSMEANRSTK